MDWRPAIVGQASDGLGTVSRVGFARMVTHDTGGTGHVSLCSLSCRCASSRCVRDQVYNACLRDILVRCRCCHLVRHLFMVGCVVAHRHARTSSHSAERLNPCLSGKEFFHTSMFPVTCASMFPYFSAAWFDSGYSSCGSLRRHWCNSTFFLREPGSRTLRVLCI